MTRTLTITAAEWASVQDGTLWLVREGREFYDMATRLYHPSLPPVEFTLACAPCETCDGDCRLVNLGRFGPPYAPCPDCRIELVSPCLLCGGSGRTLGGPLGEDVGDCRCAMTEGLIVFGHAYAVGEPLLLHDWPGVGISPGMLKALAHYGPPEEQIGKWAIKLRVVGS